MTKNDREQLAALAKLFLDAWVNADEPKPVCECGHERSDHTPLGCQAAELRVFPEWEPNPCDCKGYAPSERTPHG